MKKLILSIALVAAFTANAEISEKEKMDLCNSGAELSKNIMTARQNGVEARKLFEMIATQFDGELLKIWQQMVVIAYKTPQYSSPKNKQREINSFSNEFFLSCVGEVK